METLNLVASICSILGLLIAIFITSKVITINNNKKDKSSNKVKQKFNITGGGDVAGRDVNKK